MSFLIHKFGQSVELLAAKDGLQIRTTYPGMDLTTREYWPQDALASPGGWRCAIEIEQLLELGLAECVESQVVVPYGNFREIDEQIPVALTKAWSKPSPYLLKTDRKSDLGRPDFLYKHQFLLGGRPAYGERQGYYVKQAGSGEIFRLDHQMYSLLDAMDGFNTLDSEQKDAQTSWLTFAKVKGCAAEVGATLDSALQKNDVVIPSAVGLDMYEHEDGALSFLPKCEELATEEFQQVFERNPGAEKLYLIDRPGLGRVRIVLTDEQHQVLRRMKRVRRVRGDIKEKVTAHPEQIFDGILDSVELPDLTLPYGERVIGIGEFTFVPIPKRTSEESAMADLWRHDNPEPGFRERDALADERASADETNVGKQVSGPGSESHPGSASEAGTAEAAPEDLAIETRCDPMPPKKVLSAAY